MNILKRTLAATCLALSLCSLSFAGSAHDTCGSLGGTWKGNAELKLFFFTCQYESVAKVDSGNPASAEVNFTKTSGVFLCPNEGTNNVTVTCDHGRVEMKDSTIDVAGQLSDDGRSANFSGSLYALLGYRPFNLTVNKVS